MKIQNSSTSYPEFMQDLARGSTQPLFSNVDYSILRKNLSQLQGHERSVVMLRFWESNTISEIAEILELTWQDVESYLTRALAKLKNLCLENQEFSRSTPSGETKCDLSTSSLKHAPATNVLKFPNRRAA